MSRTRREKESKLKRRFSWARSLTGPRVILIAAVIAVGPLFFIGPSCGGDFGFHFGSWIDAERSMSMGLLYPHWANGPNFGAGEPRFVFYPPISWICGAVLGMFLPWSLVPVILSLLLLAATGMANRALAREVMEDGPATLAGCAAIFLGPVLFNVYKRNDFAELTAGFWIPLLLLFALRRRNPSGSFWERTFDGSGAPMALIVAGIWLSNGPLGIMASYLLAAVTLVSALIEKSPVPVVRATVSTSLGMGLASLYLIPAVWERKWVSIQHALDPARYAVENNWIFAHNFDPLTANRELFLPTLSILAVAMLVITCLGGAIAWIRGVVPGERRWWLPMALIAPVVLFLLLPVSLPVWNLVPEMRLLQFPWRWLVVLESPMAICFASAVWIDRKALRIPVLGACAIVFVGTSFAAPKWWFAQCGSTVASLQESIRDGIGFPGKPEFMPPGIRLPLLDFQLDAQGNPVLDPSGHLILQFLPDACLLDTPSATSVQGKAGLAPAWHGESANCNSSGWRELTSTEGLDRLEPARSLPEEKAFEGVAEHAGYLILRLRYYPAWGVKVNGMPVTAMAERERGLMTVPVPKGNVRVSANWITTGDAVAGRWTSGIALLLVAILYLFEQKRVRAALNSGNAKSFIFTWKPNLPRVAFTLPTPPVPKGRRNKPSGERSKTTGQK